MKKTPSYENYKNFTHADKIKDFILLAESKNFIDSLIPEDAPLIESANGILMNYLPHALVPHPLVTQVIEHSNEKPVLQALEQLISLLKYADAYLDLISQHIPEIGTVVSKRVTDMFAKIFVNHLLEEKNEAQTNSENFQRLVGIWESSISKLTAGGMIKKNQRDILAEIIANLAAGISKEAAIARAKH